MPSTVSNLNTTTSTTTTSGTTTATTRTDRHTYREAAAGVTLQHVAGGGQHEIAADDESATVLDSTNDATFGGGRGGVMMAFNRGGGGGGDGQQQPNAADLLLYYHQTTRNNNNNNNNNNSPNDHMSRMAIIKLPAPITAATSTLPPGGGGVQDDDATVSRSAPLYEEAHKPPQDGKDIREDGKDIHQDGNPRPTNPPPPPPAQQQQQRGQVTLQLPVVRQKQQPLATPTPTSSSSSSESASRPSSRWAFFPALRIPLALVLLVQIVVVFAAFIAVISVLSLQQEREFKNALYKQLSVRLKASATDIMTPFLSREKQFDMLLSLYTTLMPDGGEEGQHYPYTAANEQTTFSSTEAFLKLFTSKVEDDPLITVVALANLTNRLSRYRPNETVSGGTVVPVYEWDMFLIDNIDGIARTMYVQDEELIACAGVYPLDLTRDDRDLVNTINPDGTHTYSYAKKRSNSTNSTSSMATNSGDEGEGEEEDPRPLPYCYNGQPFPVILPLDSAGLLGTPSAIERFWSRPITTYGIPVVGYVVQVNWAVYVAASTNEDGTSWEIDRIDATTTNTAADHPTMNSPNISKTDGDDSETNGTTSSGISRNVEPISPIPFRAKHTEVHNAYMNLKATHIKPIIVSAMPFPEARGSSSALFAREPRPEYYHNAMFLVTGKLRNFNETILDLGESNEAAFSNTWEGGTTPDPILNDAYQLALRACYEGGGDINYGYTVGSAAASAIATSAASGAENVVNLCPDGKTFEFKSDHNNKKYIASVIRILDARTVVDWLLVQYTPREEFFAASDESRAIGIGIGCVGAFAVFLSCILIWMAIFSPIRRLRANMALAAIMKNDEVDGALSPILKEMGDLVEAFSVMNSKLLRARPFLPQSLLCVRQDVDDEEYSVVSNFDQFDEEEYDLDTDTEQYTFDDGDTDEVFSATETQNHKHGGKPSSVNVNEDYPRAGVNGGAKPADAPSPIAVAGRATTTPSDDRPPAFKPQYLLIDRDTYSDAVRVSQQRGMMVSPSPPPYGAVGSNNHQHVATFAGGHDLVSSNATVMTMGSDTDDTHHNHQATRAGGAAGGEDDPAAPAFADPSLQQQQYQPTIVSSLASYPHTTKDVPKESNFPAPSTFEGRGEEIAVGGEALNDRRVAVRGHSGGGGANDYNNIINTHQRDDKALPVVANRGGGHHIANGAGQHPHHYVASPSASAAATTMMMAPIVSTMQTKRVGVLSINVLGFRDLFFQQQAQQLNSNGNTATYLPSSMAAATATPLVVSVPAIHARLTNLIERTVGEEKGIVDYFHGDRFVCCFNTARPCVNVGIAGGTAAIKIWDRFRFGDESNGRHSEQHRAHPHARKGLRGGTSDAAHRTAPSPPQQPLIKTLPRGIAMGLAIGRAAVGNHGSANMQRLGTMGAPYSEAMRLQEVMSRRVMGASTTHHHHHHQHQHGGNNNHNNNKSHNNAAAESNNQSKSKERIMHIFEDDLLSGRCLVMGKTFQDVSSVLPCQVLGLVPSRELMSSGSGGAHAHHPHSSSKDNSPAHNNNNHFASHHHQSIEAFSIERNNHILRACSVVPYHPPHHHQQGHSSGNGTKAATSVLPLAATAITTIIPIGDAASLAKQQEEIAGSNSNKQHQEVKSHSTGGSSSEHQYITSITAPPLVGEDGGGYTLHSPPEDDEGQQRSGGDRAATASPVVIEVGGLIAIDNASFTPAKTNSSSRNDLIVAPRNGDRHRHYEEKKKMKRGNNNKDVVVVAESLYSTHLLVGVIASAVPDEDVTADGGEGPAQSVVPNTTAAIIQQEYRNPHTTCITLAPSAAVASSAPLAMKKKPSAARGVTICDGEWMYQLNHHHNTANKKRIGDDVDGSTDDDDDDSYERTNGFICEAFVAAEKSKHALMTMTSDAASPLTAEQRGPHHTNTNKLRGDAAAQSHPPPQRQQSLSVQWSYHIRRLLQKAKKGDNEDEVDAENKRVHESSTTAVASPAATAASDAAAFSSNGISMSDISSGPTNVATAKITAVGGQQQQQQQQQRTIAVTHRLVMGRQLEYEYMSD